MLTHKEAVDRLRDGGSFVELGEAIGVLISSRQTTIDELLLGLHHPGFVAEQAAIALYRRTGRGLPFDHKAIVTDYTDWMGWLQS